MQDNSDGAGAPRSKQGLQVNQIDVAVFDEHEIFRRGTVGCLAADPLMRVVAEGSEPMPVDADVAVVSMRVATNHEFRCPLVVCDPGEPTTKPLTADDGVLAVLIRNHVSADQLVSAVRAASVGLSIQPSPRPSGSLDSRSIEVLQLLAEGAATKEISDKMGYSERTIKGIIRDISIGLGARSRAHAVATALREHLI